VGFCCEKHKYLFLANIYLLELFNSRRRYFRINELCRKNESVDGADNADAKSFAAHAPSIKGAPASALCVLV